MNLSNEIDEAIVRRSASPAEPSLYDKEPFKKPRSGERLNIDVHTIVEPIPGEPMLKRTKVHTTLPGWSSWEVLCDEGTTGGGGDQAPAPLLYFSAGIALCFGTHVQINAMLMDVSIKSFRIEQKTRFSTSFNFVDAIIAGDLLGAGDILETHIIIESDDDTEKLQQFTRYCEQACMAGQMVAQSPNVATVLHVNGTAYQLGRADAG